MNTKNSFFEPNRRLGQVRTSWQWHRTLLANVAASEQNALRLNLDETSIVLNYDDQKGVVTPQTDTGPVLVPKKSSKRGSLTHVVLICDDTAVQPLLPQFIIGNEHILRVTDMQTLEPETAANIYIVRAKSSWITAEWFVLLLGILSKTLRQNEVAKKPILLLDGCPVHLTPAVWKTAKRYGIFLCFVPATLTWIVQPLDVSVIRKLKADLRAHYRRLQIERREARIPVVDVIRLLMRSVKRILQGTAWASAFDECGYSAHCTGVRSQIRNMFARAQQTDLSTPTEQPTAHEITEMLPKKRVYDLNLLLWACPRNPPAICHAASAAASTIRDSSTHADTLPGSMDASCISGHIFEHADDTRPIALRTRSRSAFLSPVPEATEFSSTARGSADPCPSWIPSSQTATKGSGLRKRDLRPQALPRPKKPRWI